MLLDKGPLPNPGGSTGHASNFIFPTDHNKEMALLTLESQRQYVELGVNNDVRRHRGRPRRRAARGVQPPHDVGQGVGHRGPPADAGRDQGARAVHQRRHRARRLLHAERVGGRLAADGHADARGGDRQGRAAGVRQHRGARPRGRPTAPVTAVVTDKGRIEAEHVAIACGVWSPRIAAMAGANIPLTPAVHQMADVGPIDMLAGDRTPRSPTRSSATWTRSATSARSAGSMEVGSYAHRPIFHHPDDIPSNEESALSPTELPFTADDFDHADGSRRSS